MESEGIICFGFGFILGGLIFGITVSGAMQSSWRSEAIEKGYAEYVLKGSEAVWQWKNGG